MRSRAPQGEHPLPKSSPEDWRCLRNPAPAARRHPRRVGCTGEMAVRCAGKPSGCTPCMGLEGWKCCGGGGSGRWVPAAPLEGAHTRRSRHSGARLRESQEGGGVWPQSSLRQMGGLGVKALQRHPGGEHCHKSLGLGCPGRADSAASSTLALTARPHRRRPVIPDAPGGESDPRFCLDGESPGLAVTRHTVPVRPLPSRDPAGREGREHAASPGKTPRRGWPTSAGWHHGPRSARSPGSLNPTSARVGTSGARPAADHRLLLSRHPRPREFLRRGEVGTPGTPFGASRSFSLPPSPPSGRN